MEVLRSYVVRVYRQESDAVTGVIESVETGRVRRFAPRTSCGPPCLALFRTAVSAIQPHRSAGREVKLG